jgi:hypothetical protein
MKFWIACIVTMVVLPFGISTNAAAGEGANDEVDDIKRILEEQEQTIDQLKARIGELEAETEASEPPPVGAAASEVSESGEVQSPFEQAEEEMGLRGRKAPVTYRQTYTDRQEAAARPGDFVLDPEYRGFIPVPKTVFLIKLNAKPRVDMIASSEGAGTDFRFVPALFPVDDESGYGGGWRFSANANGSQLRMDIRAPSMKGNFRFYYQNDFFGDNQKHMRYRLQHLYGEFYGVLGGFTYGLFEDPDAWPDTVDYEGPNAVVFARRALGHYKMSLFDDWELTVGLEDPDIYVDIPEEADAAKRTRAPDGGFNIRWTPGELGHVQFSTIFRSIGIQGDDVSNQDVFGWGVNLAGSLNVADPTTIQFWFVYGNGVGGMGNDTSFLNSDAALDANGRLVALRYWSAMGAVTHRWTPRWRSTATYGYVNLENTAAQEDNAYRLSHYASANVMYQVFKRLSVGLEGLYGYKKVKSGADSDVFRIQLGFAYSIFD